MLFDRLSTVAYSSSLRACLFFEPDIHDMFFVRRSVQHARGVHAIAECYVGRVFYQILVWIKQERDIFYIPAK